MVRNGCLSIALVMLGVGFAWADTVLPSPYWKNQIAFPDEPFRVQGENANDPDWVKFTILLSPYDPNIVYYQDCQTYEFHYGFAVDLLPPFFGMTPQQFDLTTLYTTNRQAVLGAVIMPPTGGWPTPPAYPEYGIQLIGLDPFTPEEVVQLFNTVKQSVSADPGVTAYYFPSYEQTQVARDNEAWFQSQGIEISSSARWSQGNVAYAEGWALGRLKFFPGSYIETAYMSGELEPNDILLTDGVPPEIPSVAGILTLSPSTPNSHVAILAQAFNVPFGYLALADDANNALGLIGNQVVLRVEEQWDSPEAVRLMNVEGMLDEATIEEILQFKEPPELNIQPMQNYGAYSASTDGLGPSQIGYFGGKASNYGLLRQSIPDNSYKAFAFGFNLWNEFLDQVLPNSRTLREEIALRLAPFTYPPSDMAQFSNTLDGIRDLFKDTEVTHFTSAQESAVIGVLQDPVYEFDPSRKIRFRSSSNMEDSETFVGAGLYDSYSGCLADDTDGDDQGPSICDDEENNERGVFRAIRKVYASFYNDNAYLQRLRYGVDENDVGMSLLVHHSFPDETELANGVATFSRTNPYSARAKLVTQLGAVSVSNPSDGSIPEEVDMSVYSFGYYPNLVQQSNLVPLGDTVMDWQDDYVELSQLLAAVADRFSAVTGKTRYTLDFEYKKTAPNGDLIVKQVRELPQADSSSTVPAFLLGQPTELCTFQGEYGDVFANHRLKSRVTLHAISQWLDPNVPTDSLYTTMELQYAVDGRVRRLQGILPSMPQASHSVAESGTSPYYPAEFLDGWRMHHLSNRRRYAMRTLDVPTRRSVLSGPVLLLSDLDEFYFEVDYERSVPTMTWEGPAMTTHESIQIEPCPTPNAGDLDQSREIGPVSIKGLGTVSIQTRFYWPPDPGAAAGYTAPCIRWVETTVSGLTSEPVVLHDWYAQTYRPGHHNFSEEFLFEPRLDPNVSQEQLDELEGKDVRLIYGQIGGLYPVIKIYGFNEEPFLGADIDGDGKVNMCDAALLFERWLDSACDECGGRDLDGDGCVHFSDFEELMGQWLTSL